MTEHESFYPLSPTQQGLLFHSLLAPDSGVYVGQLVCRLAGRLDVEALRRAWQAALDRHAVLRTSFRWKDLKEPIQVVHRQAELPFEVLDWRDAGGEEQAARLEELLRADRARGFDLATAPLLRCRLARLAADTWEFVWTRHHLIVDGWSVALVLKEVFASYAALVEGREPAPEPAAAAYRDYIVWLRRQKREEAAVRWRQALAGVTAATPLGIDQDGQAGRRGAITLEERYGSAEARLAPETVAALQSAARRAGLTVNTLFQGAWALLLARYGNSSEVVFGTVVAGRPPAVAGIDSMVGLFINTQPLRARVPANTGVDNGLLPWLRELQAAQAGLRQDEHLSLQEIQAWSEVPRGQPLFESLLVFENFPVDASLRSGAGIPAGLRVSDIRAGERTNFPLTLVTGPSDPWLLTVSYDRERFPDAAIRRLLGHAEALLAALIEAMAGGLENRLDTLVPLTAAERAQVLGEWNDTAERGEDPVSSLPAWVAGQVARTPDAVALQCEDRQTTYEELARRARALAARLERLGVGPGTRVGIALDRAEPLVIGLLGTLWTGAAYVPLDPAYPLERLASMLEDSRAGALLAGEGPVAALAGAGCVRLAPDEWEPAVPPAGAPGAPDLPASLPCYLLYTSGSTGRPKGVEVSHGAVINFLRAMRRQPGLAGSDRLVAVTSLSFDIAGLEIFLPLGSGARIELASREAAADAVRLRRLIERSGATVLQATPSTWRLLLAAGFEAKAPFKQLCGGETLSRELADRLLAGGAELWNLYGPTETTIWSAVERVEPGTGPVPVGRPLRNTSLYVLDGALRPVPVGLDGELYIGGDGLASGYAGRAGQTAERFVPDPFGTSGGQRLYRTGDRVRWLPDGRLEHRGRLDHQVKLRGHRIEPGEIEAALERHPAVAQAVLLVQGGPGGEPRLVAYVVPAAGAEPAPGPLRRHLEQVLPAVMVPATYVFLQQLPATPNGKVDRKALAASPPADGEGAERSAYEAPGTPAERLVAEAWQQVLGLERVGRDDSFFDLGGTSMLAIQVHHKLQHSLGVEVSLVDLFEHPTVGRLAAALQARIDGRERSKPPEAVPAVPNGTDGAVAVIGMACRVPGARSVEGFWRNLLDGVESITSFSREELLAGGLPADVADDPRLIAARGCLDGIDEFDAPFFGVTPREAELLDPQHRIFLECAWEALERAGYGGEETGARVGVFAGASLNGYLLANIAPQLQEVARDAAWQVLLGNDKDYLTTRVSYLLGLTGPSLLVQTACSTSLVAIHLARESILRGECEMALAGGVSGRVPQAAGQIYQEGGINSPDGHCRAFDASARGTVGGNGAGVVVLKALPAALRDGDRIVAVLKGSAINNDGARKVGFTAPSVEGQAAVIRAALAAAGVDGRSIGYVEAHGTGTPLGDPIEVRALAQALGGGWSRPCWLGSVKTNIGHLDTAAGVAGFIKAALAVEQGEIPPSLHLEVPSPRIDWSAGPFAVARERTPWPAEDRDRPRRAGVSSFGIGGTNAHAVLEQAPPRRGPGPSRPLQLLVWSAKTESALARMTERLREHLAAHPEQALADVAWTLALGRRRFPHRRALVCATAAEAVAALGTGRRWEETEAERGEASPPVAFLFPGQGSVHPGMGEGLFRRERIFRQAVERCSEVIERAGGESLAARLYGPPERRWTAAELEETQHAQPALFAVCYALAELWRSWGLEPWAMLGHSVGEYVAATLAGVLELEAALELIRERGRLMGLMPRGAMLSVELPAGEVEGWLGDDVSLAAENGPRLSVLSGTVEAISQVEAALAARGVSCRRLATSHAFHSAMMEPVLEAFGAVLRRVQLSPPQRPYLSCLTGTWVRAEEATDPGYWLRHLRQPVRFSAALGELLGAGRVVCVEAGPGRALSSLVRHHPAKTADSWVLGSLPPPGPTGTAGTIEPDEPFLLRSLGRYWLAGGEVDWPGVFAGEARRREPLPPYPFERHRYWLEPPAASEGSVWRRTGEETLPARLPVWRQGPAVQPGTAAGAWVVAGAEPAAGTLASRLRAAGAAVRVAVEMAELATHLEAAREEAGDEGVQLVLLAGGFGAAEWALAAPPAAADLLGAGARLVRLVIVTRGQADVLGDEPLSAEAGAAVALARQRLGEKASRSIDLPPAAASSPPADPPAENGFEDDATLLDRLLSELLAAHPEPQVALRGRRRFVRDDDPAAPAGSPPAGRSNRPRLPSAYVPPATETERVLVDIWQSLLHITPIGIDDDFFELGGHSLLGTQVMSRLNAAFGRQLPLRLLFEAPTVERLAAQLALSPETGPEAPPLLAQARPEVLPLSFAQQRLWFLDQLDPGNPAYNLAFPVRARGALRPDLLAHAFAGICRRHEVLRTRFVVEGGRPAQQVDVVYPGVRVVDLDGLPAGAREDEARRLGVDEAGRPFDLGRGPLMRTLLLRLAADEQVVVTTLHHIVADGWSLGLLLAELEALYRAAAEGRPSPLPELAVQYADFALWQRQWLSGDNLERRLGYWKRQLGGELAALEMPVDRPRPAVPSFRGADLRFALPALPAAGGSTGSAGGRHGVTLFMTLLAAFQALLHRYTGQTDVVVGSPVANRGHVEIEPLIGFFVNSLVLRTDLGGDPSFAQLQERVQEVALGAQAHQDVPFELLVQELRPERDLSRTPLFQTLFTLQNAPAGAIELPGVRLQPEILASSTAAFDLSLSLAGGEEGLRGVLNYRSDLFDEPTIRRLAAHFERLLAAALENPALPVSRLPLLSRAERHQLLAEWQSDLGGQGGAGETLHGLFAVRAGERPEAVAVSCGDEHLSYGELARRAGRLARHLRGLGAGPGSPTVGICLERSPELVVALLAVLASGAAYLPLDPSYPEQRLAFMLEDSGTRLVIAQDGLLAGFPGHRVDGERDVPRDDRHVASPAIEVPAASPAYLLYTSGSTGRPKGVTVPHGAIVRFLTAMREAPGLGRDDALAAVTTLSFDIAALEIFLPLSVGARVEVVSREEAADPRELARRVAVSGASVMQATPATWQLLVDRGWDNPSRVRVLCGGEAFPRTLADALLDRAPEVWNLYGPTETTVWSAVERVGRGALPPAAGRPIRGTRLVVLDAGGNPVPAGVTGEVHIGGAGLARGYHGRPELTAASYVPDASGTEPGARLYRTGDLGRLLADGRLQVLGRRDLQVKVRGFRIELAEIEAALGRHPAVGQAVVVARPLKAGDSSQLVAYVVAAPGAAERAPTADELRTFLAGTLPAYMLPTSWVFLAELPHTPNGKVDRRALPAPTGERPDGEATYVAPRNPVEEAVAEIWREVLGIERVGVHDSFFALGGHSLLATQVTSRLFETFQVDLPLRRLFAQGTVAGVAAAILEEQLGHLSEEERSLLARADQLSEEQLTAELARLKEQERG